MLFIFALMISGVKLAPSLSKINIEILCRASFFRFFFVYSIQVQFHRHGYSLIALMRVLVRSSVHLICSMMAGPRGMVVMNL